MRLLNSLLKATALVLGITAVMTFFLGMFYAMVVLIATGHPVYGFSVLLIGLIIMTTAIIHTGDGI